MRDLQHEDHPNSANPCRYQKHNRFFDSVSLRYHFAEGEKHEVKPRSDGLTTVNVTDEVGTSTEAKEGLSASGLGAITPSIEVHYQSNETIKVEHKSEAWRCGMALERCMFISAASL